LDAFYNLDVSLPAWLGSMQAANVRKLSAQHREAATSLRALLEQMSKMVEDVKRLVAWRTGKVTVEKRDTIETYRSHLLRLLVEGTLRAFAAVAHPGMPGLDFQGRHARPVVSIEQLREFINDAREEPTTPGEWCADMFGILEDIERAENEGAESEGAESEGAESEGAESEGAAEAAPAEAAHAGAGDLGRACLKGNRPAVRQTLHREQRPSHSRHRRRLHCILALPARRLTFSLCCRALWARRP
jgi:hypothetical protein